MTKPPRSQLAAPASRNTRVSRMSDVARLAGVTAMTVSRFLRTPDAVSEDTRRKIEEAIRHSGFVPNYAARSLVSKQSQIIVALFPTLMNSVFSGTIEEFSRQLSLHGYHLLLGETRFDILEEQRLLSGLLGWRPAGIILTGSEHTVATRQMLDNSQAPVIELWNLPRKPFDLAVGFSNRGAAYAMTRALYDWGYRRIGFMNLHYPHNDRSVDRRNGYRDAMNDLGLTVSKGMEITVPFGIEPSKAATQKLLAQSDRIDALLCASDTLAVGALMGALRSGLRVPQDLAIAGFGDVELASSVVPSLTTVRVPRAEIARETARILLERLNGTYDGPSVIDCGFSIIRRESA